MSDHSSSDTIHGRDSHFPTTRPTSTQADGGDRTGAPPAAPGHRRTHHRPGHRPGRPGQGSERGLLRGGGARPDEPGHPARRRRCLPGNASGHRPRHHPFHRGDPHRGAPGTSPMYSGVWMPPASTRRCRHTARRPVRTRRTSPPCSAHLGRWWCAPRAPRAPRAAPLIAVRAILSPHRTGRAAGRRAPLSHTPLVRDLIGGRHGG
jgi:hypothetical protein